MLKNSFLLLFILFFGLSPLLLAGTEDGEIHQGDSGSGVFNSKTGKPRDQSEQKRCVCVFEGSHLKVYLDPKCRGEAGRVDAGSSEELPSEAIKVSGCPSKGMITIYHRQSDDSCTAKTLVAARCKEF